MKLKIKQNKKNVFDRRRKNKSINELKPCLATVYNCKNYT